eukprot:Selendium_serpulae@DN5865_c0_g1_i4.p1
MPDLAPKPVVTTEAQALSNESLISGLLGLFTAMFLPATPLVIYEAFWVHRLFRGEYWSDAFTPWMTVGFLVAALASWLMFWCPANPIYEMKTLQDETLVKKCRDQSIGATAVDSKEKVLVVGCGFAGLAMSASLIRRGIPFDAVDAQDDIGGLWYTGGYNNVHILSSRRITEFKDWPMPAGCPEFPSQKVMLEYFRSYADKWKIRDFTKFNTYAKLVEPVDGGETGYKVTLETGTKPHKQYGSTPETKATDEKKDEAEANQMTVDVRQYKAVVICVGHHRLARHIHNKVPGNFTGEVMHSSQYKKPEQLEGKRVLTVGAGNSAMDITVEAAKYGVEAHNSMRQGRWMSPRTIFGIPSLELAGPWWPMWFVRFVQQAAVMFNHGNYSRYGLSMPNHRFGDFHPTISVAFLEHISFGEIKPHCGLQKYNGKTVTFTDGTSTDIDLIIYCTGYDLRFPLLDDSKLIDYVQGIPFLVYGSGVPKRRNLYLFGVQQPRYGGGPLLTRGAELVAEAIETQNFLPKGVNVLDYLGKIFLPYEFPTLRPTNTTVIDCPDALTCPFSFTKRMQIGRCMMAALPRLARQFPMVTRDYIYDVELVRSENEAKKAARQKKTV